MSWWNYNFIIGSNMGETLDGTAGNDIIIAKGGDDTINAGDGHDLVFAGRGDDIVDAGSGNDVVFAGKGDDIVYGGDGCDWLVGGRGSDTLYGGAHSDYLNGGSGDDYLDGGSGNDYIRAGRGNDTAHYNVDENVGDWDFYHGGRGWDTLVIEVDASSLAALGPGYASAQDFIDAVEAHFAADNVDHKVNFDVLGFDLFAKRFEHVDVIVNGVVNNDPIAMDDSFSISENDVINASAPGVLVNDLDSDLDPITVIAVNGESADVGMQITLGSGALLTLNSDGSYDYDTNGQFESLAVGADATDSFEYTISDGNGGVDTATVNITINGANDAPVAQDDFFFTNEEDAANPPPITGNVLVDNGAGADSDIDMGDTLTVIELNGNAADVGGGLVTLASGARMLMDANGDFAYAANVPGSFPTESVFDYLAQGESFIDTFEYTISDSSGATHTATAHIEIAGVNDDPLAVDDVNVTDEDNTVMGNMLANDSDIDISDIPNLEVIDVEGDTDGSVTLASGAIVTFDAMGNYTYDPNGAFESLNAGDVAMDSFDYTISDGNGGLDAATVNITIEGVTDAPPAILAVAYSDLNSNNTFDPENGDRLIAKLLDNDNSGTVTVGDTIEVGEYPTNFDATTFASFDSSNVISITDVEVANNTHIRVLSGDYLYQFGKQVLTGRVDEFSEVQLDPSFPFPFPLGSPVRITDHIPGNSFDDSDAIVIQDLNASQILPNTATPLDLDKNPPDPRLVTDNDFIDVDFFI